LNVVKIIFPPFFFSLPKFRKGILALICCKKLGSIKFDPPTQARKRIAKQKTLEHNLSWPSAKKPVLSRVRFQSTNLDSIDEIDSESSSGQGNSLTGAIFETGASGVPSK
jgi:hypothetical protein